MWPRSYSSNFSVATTRMSTISIQLSSVVNAYQQSVDSIDENWNISIAELNNLGFPEDMHEKIKEIGAKTISLITEKLNIDIHWLKEIAHDQKYIDKLAVPQEKFAKFLMEDFDESLEYLQKCTWFYSSITPDAEKLKKKWDTHLNAQMQKRGRLLKSYRHYIPTLNEKLLNLIAKKEAEILAVEKQTAEVKAKITNLEKEIVEKKAIIASLEAEKASIEAQNPN